MSDQLNQQEVDLEFTRTMRKRLVTKLTEKDIPSDLKEQSILLQTLDGIDRAALTQMRIKSDEGISNSNAQAAETLMRIFMHPDSKKIGVADQATIDTTARVIPELSLDLPVPEILDGEMASNAPIEDYKDFVARMSRENGAAA